MAINGEHSDIDVLREEFRGEFEEHKGSIVRYIADRDREMKRFISNVRSDLIGEIQKVKRCNH